MKNKNEKSEIINNRVSRVNFNRIFTYPIHASINGIKRELIFIQRKVYRSQLFENIKRKKSHLKQDKYGKYKRIKLQLSDKSQSCFKQMSHNNINDKINRLVEVSENIFIQQKNQQNNVSEIKFDPVIDHFNPETKPVNWKLQKLEKDFLLSYLENALLRYNKQTCKSTWLPSKNKDYYTKEPTTAKNCKELLSTRPLMVRSLMSPFPTKPQIKHKFAQTDDFLYRNFENTDDNSKNFPEKLGNLLKTVLETQDTALLLDLNMDEIQQLYAFINEMKTLKANNDPINEKMKISAGNKKIQQVLNKRKENIHIEHGAKDDSNNIKLLHTVNSGSQTDNQMIPSSYEIRSYPTEIKNIIDENSIINEKTITNTKTEINTSIIDDKSIDNTKIVNEKSLSQEYETGIVASEKWEEIKNVQTRISEPYENQKQGFKEPEVENVTENYVEFKTHVQSSEKINSTVNENENIDINLIEKNKDQTENYLKSEKDINKENKEKDFNDIIKSNKDKSIEDIIRSNKDKSIEDIIRSNKDKSIEDIIRSNKDKSIEDIIKSNKQRDITDDIEGYKERDITYDIEGYKERDITDDIEGYKEKDINNDREESRKVLNEINKNIEEVNEKSYLASDDKNNEIIDSENIIKSQTENDEKFEDTFHRLSDLTDKQILEENKVNHVEEASKDYSSNISSEKKLNEENFFKIKNLITQNIGEGNDNLLSIMTNKSELFEILLIVNETIKMITLNIPATEEMTSVFIKNLTSIQTEARLSRITNEADPGEEILIMYGEMCDFLDDAMNNDEQLQLIVNNAHLVVDKNIISPNVREIIENPELFVKVLILIHFQYHHVDNRSLVTFFNTLPTFKTESTSVSKDTDNYKNQYSHFLDDETLIANLVIVIELWNRKYNYINSKLFTLTINSLKEDIENVKKYLFDNNLWVSNAEAEQLEFYKKSEIFIAYEEYLKFTNEIDSELLIQLFKYPENVFAVISRIEVTQKLVDFINNLLSHLKINFDFKEYLKSDLAEDELLLIDEILKDKELIRQLLAIVDYWVTENLGALYTTFDENNLREDYLINYKRDGLNPKVYYQMMLSVIYWLKTFIDSADQEDIPQEIINDNFYSTNLYVLKDAVKPDENLNIIFKNPNVLLNLFLKVKNSLKGLTSQNSDISAEISQSAALKIDKHKSDKLTEPITSSPQISVAFGKNQRFSNSQADNKERFSDNNQESTYMNVSSLAIKNNQEISIDEQIEEEKIWDNDGLEKSENYECHINEFIPAPINTLCRSESILKDTESKRLTKKASFTVDELYKRASDLDPAHPFVKVSPPPSANNSPVISKSESDVPGKNSKSESLVVEKIDEETGKNLYERNCIVETNSRDEDMVYVEKVLSFNSQMNTLSAKLDEALTSINIQYEEMKDIKLDEKSDSNKEISDQNLVKTNFDQKVLDSNKEQTDYNEQLLDLDRENSESSKANSDADKEISDSNRENSESNKENLDSNKENSESSNSKTNNDKENFDSNKMKSDTNKEKSKSPSQHSVIIDDEEINTEFKSVPNVGACDRESIVDGSIVQNGIEIKLVDDKSCSSIRDKQGFVKKKFDNEEDASGLIEIQAEETEIIDFTIGNDVQDPPEMCLSRSSLRFTNEDEDIISTLGFMIYYLLTIISSKHIL